MFETVELDRKVSKDAFKATESSLRTQLLAMQEAIREANIPVILIVSGVEGAGKSEVINRLNKWLDARGIETNAFWDETDEERERPRLWRFWRTLPARGKLGIMFGSWYTQPIVEYAFGKSSEIEFEHQLQRVNELERTLTLDGALVVKLWFHITAKTQHKRLKKKFSGRNAKSLEQKFAKHYDQFKAVSENAIRITDTGLSPWHLVEAEDKRYRDLRAAQILLESVSHRINAAPQVDLTSGESWVAETNYEPNVTVLDKVPLDLCLTEQEYAEQLKTQQTRLQELAWKARNQRRSVVLVFEGWDAAGKGGAIRRVTSAVDARLFRVISIAAPTDEEKGHHYLWRFWRHVPRSGYLTIYDRSWYGRVLVERVEGFAKQVEWRRSFQEINDFEGQLNESGIILNKYWLHISQEEQLRRFKEREQIPWKQHKITEEDWRNRESWDKYRFAVNDMVTHTSTSFAPWHIIPANDKRFARVQVLRTLCDNLENSLE